MQELMIVAESRPKQLVRDNSLIRAALEVKKNCPNDYDAWARLIQEYRNSANVVAYLQVETQTERCLDIYA